jgi:predicted 3-demethylubiquinone-9 3-methyltransferase (glyoxalase superfamily)
LPLRPVDERYAAATDEQLLMPRDFKPLLMFQRGDAEEAMRFYADVLAGTINRVERFGPGEPGAEGKIKQATLIIAGHELRFLDSPPVHAFDFTPSVSLCVSFDDVAEIDTAFARLAEDGQVLMPLGDYGWSTRFGWVKDRFGIAWQLDVRPAA